GHLGGTNKPLRYLPKGKEMNEHTRAETRRRCTPHELRVLRYVRMTLYNGYLGSRIDKERSEMQ
ncbi:hypothetical protein TorRG33x02_042790, partial [Trema orientale]